jgi:Uma2 family endonuclease
MAGEEGNAMLMPARKLMTTEELLALPDDGMERWLIDGELRERQMTVRNRFHSHVLSNVVAELVIWLRTQPEPRGQVLCGEAGVVLSRDPDSTVGMDVAYVTHEMVARQTDETTLFEGVPVLAVEVLSPSTTVEQLTERRALYRRARVPLVWIIDPDDQTVTVYRPGAKPVLVNTDGELVGEPELPGFRVPVARLFA